MRDAAGQRGRDEKWFVELYERAYADVLRYACRRVDEDTARDAAAETFLVAWRRLDVIPAEPLPWLYGVARGVLANESRRTRRQGRTARRIAASPPVAPRDHSDRIGEKELSEADLEVISLVAWEGLEAQAAAQVVGCSTSAFSVRLHRARQRLQLALADQQVERPPAGTSSSGDRASGEELTR